MAEGKAEICVLTGEILVVYNPTSRKDYIFCPFVVLFGPILVMDDGALSSGEG
jgi:hypothetical protein